MRISLFATLSCFFIIVTGVSSFSPFYSDWSCRDGAKVLASISDDSMSELYRRIDNLSAFQKMQDSLLSKKQIMLPVLALDALLPNQRLEATTSDPTFSRFLRDVGLGGLFVMTSVNHSKRMVRRNGVVVKIELVDAAKTNERTPTAVDFSIKGICRARLVGPSKGFKARVGRWRRAYDPDGEESVLGWGQERFIDALENATSVPTSDKDEGSHVDLSTMPATEWSLNQVDCVIQDDDCNDVNAMERVQRIIPLLGKFESLASDVKTYENTDVVATCRILKGQPGISVDPAALLRSVRNDLGEMPCKHPTDFSFWGAALVNPLPPLGVSPEIRGRILEAPNALNRLILLEWGVKRAIRNLEGTDPL
mmetsp:Transcript_3501/g.6428  ORF Transcript_3501/g.6428 Transcript_3501/m.6428 type:complete len:366 (+) Transcript_3501:108-1205(+)